MAPATSLADTYGLQPLTTYTYNVSAIDTAYSESAQSRPVSVTTPANNSSTCTYTISTSASPAGGGTASGGGTVNCSSTVTVSANPAACYSFVNWTANGTVVSTSPSYTFNATANLDVVANFAAVPYTISVSSSAGGSATGGGTYNCGSSVTVSASPAACYTFVNWTAGATGALISTSPAYTFTPTANQSLVANFAPITYSISTTSSPVSGGSTTGGGSVTCGSSVTVNAAAAAAYSFANWTLNGTVVSTSPSYSFTPGGNASLVANFTTISCTFSLSTSSDTFSAAGGSGSLTVNASASTCAWSASTTYGWLHTSSSGTGTGTASFTVDANSSSSSRSGTLTIAGQTFTVTQSGHTAPVANAGPNQSASVGTALTFNGSGNAYDGATITAYNWNFGDLTSASGATVSHTYAGAGTYTVTLTVTDSLGAPGSGTTTATITNAVVISPLSVSLTTPASGATVSGATTMSATASANTVKVEFYCDSTILVGTATVAPFSASWDTTTTANGSHTLFAKAYDASGNSTNSATSTVSVNNATTTTGGVLQWLKTSLPQYLVSTKGVVADRSGNIFAVGYFYNYADFGSGMITSAGGYDAFVLKYSPQGALLWVKRLGGIGTDEAFGVAVDRQNNVIVVGTFQGSVDFGGGAITASGGSMGADAFVAKYSPTGAYIWARNFGSGGANDLASAVAVDGSDNVVVAAQTSFTVGFGNNISKAGYGGYDVALTKFSGATGATIWGQVYGGPSQDYANGLAVDRNGDVVVTGAFGGGGNLGGAALTGSASSGMFAAKYSGVDGTYKWSRIQAANAGNAITADPGTGNVFVTGAFTGSVDFGNGTPVSTPWQQNGGFFVAAYDPSGNYLWANAYGASGDAGYAIAADGNGNLAVAGTSSGLIYFNSALTDESGEGFILTSLTTSGAFRWAERSNQGQSWGYGVSFDPLGHVVAGGSFYYTADFGGVSASTASGAYNGFVAQYSK
jgi:hypothetical protein